MNKITTLSIAIGASCCLGLLAQADEIQFTTLPQPVQTTVNCETHITGPSSVTRVIWQDSGVVQEPGTTVVERPAPATQETIVTYDLVQQNLPRYELLERKGKTKIYLDRQTGQKVKVEREKD